jgi:NTP pyrophosphatase (non-canonical NTP hydrolase)
MDFNEYQNQAWSFAMPQAQKSTYLIPGLVGEVGELTSLIAKANRDGQKQDHDEMFAKELGDILWFVSALAWQRGWKLSDVAEMNLAKLASRQKRGTIQGSGDLR